VTKGPQLRPYEKRAQESLTLDEWVNRTIEGTEDPYRYLDRDVEEREAIDDLLGRRE
jgi:hypothetical protein